MKKDKKIYFLPKTYLGKWTVGLIIAFFLFLILAMLIVASGQEGGETIFDNLLISIPMILAVVSAIASFITGIISIIWKKERGILIFISAIIGLLILWFVLGEILVPH
ncbi:MAG: hypothetical protein AABW81_03450 [Nanoarchaeota archaeon]